MPRILNQSHSGNAVYNPLSAGRWGTAIATALWAVSTVGSAAFESRPEAGSYNISQSLGALSPLAANSGCLAHEVRIPDYFRRIFRH